MDVNDHCIDQPFYFIMLQTFIKMEYIHKYK